MAWIKCAWKNTMVGMQRVIDTSRFTNGMWKPEAYKKNPDSRFYSFRKPSNNPVKLKNYNDRCKIVNDAAKIQKQDNNTDCQTEKAALKDQIEANSQKKMLKGGHTYHDKISGNDKIGVKVDGLEKIVGGKGGYAYVEGRTLYCIDKNDNEVLQREMTSRGDFEFQRKCCSEKEFGIGKYTSSAVKDKYGTITISNQYDVTTLHKMYKKYKNVAIVPEVNEQFYNDANKIYCDKSNVDYDDNIIDSVRVNISANENRDQMVIGEVVEQGICYGGICNPNKYD